MIYLQSAKKPEQTKIPSPKPLLDLFEKGKKPSKLPAPMRRNSRGGFENNDNNFPPENGKSTMFFNIVSFLINCILRGVVCINTSEPALPY